VLTRRQLDVSDDGFLSLMADDGETKDDVKVPDGEVGEKIEKLFTTEEKDTSEFCHLEIFGGNGHMLTCNLFQTSLFLRLWVSRLLSKPRRPPAVKSFRKHHCHFDLFAIQSNTNSVYGSVYLRGSRIC
jgi:hypothetical protein